MEVQQLQIRKSPLAFFNYLTISEVISLLAVFLPETIFDYEKLYNSLNFSTIVTYEIMYLIILLLATILPFLFILFYWLKTYYIVEKGRLTINKMFSQKIIPITLTKGIYVTAKGIPGLLNTGSITIIINEKEQYLLKNISDPVYYSKLIENSFEQEDIPEIGKKLSIKEILKLDENKNLEFKSTLTWDLRKKATSKDIIHSTIKTIAAFMNSEGGTLVIGITDNKEILGLDNDIQTLKKKDLDGFQNYFTMIFNDYIGAEFSSLINIRLEKIDFKDICIINIKESKNPTYVKNGEGEEFFVRVGNATYPLSIKGANQYINNHFTK